jgi:hypothetical protein
MVIVYGPLKGLGGLVGNQQATVQCLAQALLRANRNENVVLAHSCCSALAPISGTAIMAYFVQCVTCEVSAE